MKVKSERVYAQSLGRTVEVSKSSWRACLHDDYGLIYFMMKCVCVCDLVMVILVVLCFCIFPYLCSTSYQTTKLCTAVSLNKATFDTEQDVLLKKPKQKHPWALWKQKADISKSYSVEQHTIYSHKSYRGLTNSIRMIKSVWGDMQQETNLCFIWVFFSVGWGGS